jgi:polysaccharide pyruvyl transferase WcaK-like protein
LNQALLRDNLNRATVITVRERSARRVLEEAGVTRDIVITADPALLLTPAPLPDDLLCREGIDAGRRYIGLSVREPGMAAPGLDVNAYHALLANAADYMTERYDADIVFIPMERKMYDLQHSHAVIAQMLRPERAVVLKGDYSPGQILSLMKHFTFAVGMRLHFLMFAALQEIPFVALPYASKVTGFLEDLKVEAPPIQLVNPGRLIAHIDNSWDDRERLIGRIKEIMPELKQRARRTNGIAVQLLKKARRRRFREKNHAAT